MDRRAFLRALAAVSAGGVVSACAGSQNAGSNAGPTEGLSASAGASLDPVAQVAPDAEQSLSVLTATFEQLVGTSTPLAFGILDGDNVEVADAQVDLYVVPVDGEPAGPYPTSYEEVDAAPTGLYVADVPLETTGPTSFVAVTADGRAGADTVQVATAETSAFPAPGDDAPAAATPTVDAALGFDQLCTADPDCGMHEVSLDEALEAGRPIVLLFATPAYCQTAVCAPSVDVLASVRDASERDDIAFIHCEIYEDAGQTIAAPVTAWALPTEPWLYTIGTDGVIASRADGPILSLPERVTSLVQTL